MADHFFIVGAQRSGTTYLYQLLAEHPQIEMARPVRPEPKFFLVDELYALGVSEYRRRFFGYKADARVRGEKTTTYMESEVAARRIAETFPDARIVLVLRDPVERAVSNYWFSVNNGLEHLPLAAAMARARAGDRPWDRAAVSANPFDYLGRGRYAEHLAVYERYFPAHQMTVLIHERLVHGRGELDRLLADLGVDLSVALPSLGSVVNPSERVPEIPAVLRRELEAYFAEPNARLARRLGDPLPEWPRPRSVPAAT